MSYWEMRSWIESMIPWWLPFVVPMIAIVIWQWNEKDE